MRVYSLQYHGLPLKVLHHDDGTFELLDRDRLEGETALKPAAEDWWLARKPLNMTVAANVLCHGTGALNIDGCRVVTSDNLNGGAYAKEGTHRDDGWGMQRGGAGDYRQPAGRWPAHVVLSHTDRCVKVHKHVTVAKPKLQAAYSFGGEEENPGYEVVEDKDTYVCQGDCPVKMLDDQSGIQKSGTAVQRNRDGKVHNQVYGEYKKPKAADVTYGDTGGASRYFMVCSPTVVDGLGSSTGDEPCRKRMRGATSEKQMDAGTENGESQGTVGFIHNLKVAGFGSENTGLFQPTTISITKTKTRRIMTLPIWSAANGSRTGTITIDLENNIGLSEARSIVAVSLVPDGGAWLIFKNDVREPIKATVRIVRETPSKSGGVITESTIMPTCGNIGDGTSSRFFYCAKPSRRERDFGCEDLPSKTGGELTNRKEGSAGLQNPRAGAGRTSGGRNLHPTVKSQALMSWLIRLITPPNGLVLDPFMGSGSTGIGAVLEGCRFVGIEQNPEYHRVAAARVFATVREVSRGKLPDFIKKPKK